MRSSFVFLRYFRGICASGLSLLLALSCNTSKVEEPGKDSDSLSELPNFLWIVGENLNLDLGIYREPLVVTPHLDSLGKNGMVYTHVFSTGPVCAPSRSAFMTGKQHPKIE
jgi:hypothetical protein